MADVNDTSSIYKTSPPSVSMNYAALREEGLEYIQQIAPGTWTDHNIHDPGITILEALSYAITDLGARANKNIEDLLATAGNSSGIKDFFHAEEILPSAPVSITDYRKLLIDLDVIRNAWLYKATSSEQKIYLDRDINALSYTSGENLSLNGLYNVLLEFEEDETLGDLNNSIITAGIDITVGADTINHTIEVAFPFWDEISSAWKQDITLNSITLQDVPGMPAGTKLRELQTGIEHVFFAVMNIAYNTTEADQIGLTMQLTSVMQDPDTELPLVETAIVNALQDISDTGITKAYNLKIIGANTILSAVKNLLCDNRNLSEDFFAFNATRTQEIGVKATLQFSSDASVEQTVANILFQLDQFFSPPTRFYSLEEMMAMGKSIDEIYNGPLLANGFILDEDLVELKRENTIYTSDLVRIILDLNGDANVTQANYTGQNKKIISIQDLTITNYINNQVINTNVRNCLSLTLIELYKPKLSVGKSALTVIKNNVQVSYDMSLVTSIFKTLKNQQALASKTPAISSVLPVVAGNFLNVEAYASVQNDFPQTYGISYVGLPDTSSDERKAQANQLKGYLLPFEQLMADYLSQLAHIKQIFSIDADVNETYFWQTLDAVPNVAPLLATGYAAAIPTLLQQLEQTASGSRRNNFLDHLLGQFGEDFTEFALLMYNKYGDAATSELINDKSLFLKEYATLSYSRAKSYNYKGQAWNTDNVAFLKKRICRLLGITNYDQQTLSGANNEGFHIVEHILLRPKINDTLSGAIDDFLNVDVDSDGSIIEGKKDPYSFRLTFVFPNWPERFTDTGFNRYIEKIIQRETPAHILAEVHWLDEPTMQTFENAFQAWLTAVATQTNDALITPAKNDLITVLNSL
ncbi:hypothetical protein [Parafilimonas sp.]|uniref:hypothetical protein n=1 Tax=Parafilimonas sp. TaxID=1969739 RepID=UPI0039E4768D